jgi:hypothetical protein
MPETLVKTLHFAVMFGSIATFDTIEAMRITRQGAIGEWRYRATVGAIPDSIQKYCIDCACRT